MKMCDESRQDQIDRSKRAETLALTVNRPLRNQLLLNGGLACWVRISMNFPMLDTLRINQG